MYTGAPSQHKTFNFSAISIWIFFISRWALAREGDYKMPPMCVCVWVRVHVSCRFLQNYCSYRFFCKLIVPMNFHALENFWGFVDLGLVFSKPNRSCKKTFLSAFLDYSFQDNNGDSLIDTNYPWH